MNLKKMMGLLFCAALTGALLGGCGSSNTGGETGKNRAVQIGMLKNLNISEQQQAAIMEEAGKRGGFSYVQMPAVTYYDNLNTMQMGLESKSIDEMSAYKSVADYLLARNQKFELTSFSNAKLVDSFCCALREEDKELREAMDSALLSMYSDGTLARLAKEYIEDVEDGKEPPAVPIDKKDGADTIKVAVTGDLPPIDLVKADGSPAGFNTAVLAELGRRMGKNMEIVQVETGARATALTSKRVDVVFWATVPVEDLAIRPMDMDRSKGIETTVPYYKDDIVHLKLKNP